MATCIEVLGRRPVIAQTAYIASTAVLVGDVEIGADCSVWYGAVIRADFGPVRIGAAVSIQENVVMHTGTTGGSVIEDRVTVGHGAILHDCVVGAGCLIGMGAILLPGSRIGPGTVIGAGSVVLEDAEIPPGVLALGVPAAVKRRLDAADRRALAQAAADYVELARHYRETGVDVPLADCRRRSNG